MGSGEYQQLPNDIGFEFMPQTQIQDPYMTTQFMSDFFKQQLPASMDRMNEIAGDPSYLRRATAAPDQNAFMNQFGQDFGQLQNMVVGATSPLESQLQGQVGRFTEQALGDIGQQFSGANALYSSGFGKTAGEAAGKAAADAGVTLGQAQLGLLNPLATGAMTQQGQSLANARQANLQAGLQGMGGLQNMTTAMMNAASSFSRPQYTQSQYFPPEYIYDPSTFETVWPYVTDTFNLFN